MAERGVMVDHSTIHRWAIKMLPALAAVCRRRKRPVGKSWRMDETYVKVGGQWKYLYRAVDKGGDTIDFLLRAKRDHAAVEQSKCVTGGAWPFPRSACRALTLLPSQQAKQICQLAIDRRESVNLKLSGLESHVMC